MTSSNGNIFRHAGHFVQWIHWSPVYSRHKGQWGGALIFSLICAGINGWVNNGEAGNLRRHCAHYYVTVIELCWYVCCRRVWPDTIMRISKWLENYHQRLVHSLAYNCSKIAMYDSNDHDPMISCFSTVSFRTLFTAVYNDRSAKKIG